MAKKTFAVMGATGHIGHVVCEELLKKGHKVRAIGRDKAKLGQLKTKGAEIIAGDATDFHFLTEAFKGCNAVFSLLPPGYDATDLEVLRHEIGDAIEKAIVKAKTTHVINLSSIGADLTSGSGPIMGLHYHEEKLDGLDNLNVLHFRAGYFMENFFMSLPSIKSSGIIATALKKELPIPMVATRDIGLKIAELFDTLKFTGSSIFDFAGPKDVTMEEATKIIGKTIGKPELKYQHLPYEQMEKELVAHGMKHQLAKLIIEMYRGMNDGQIKYTKQVNRGKTTLEEFAKTTLSPAISSARKAA